MRISRVLWGVALAVAIAAGTHSLALAQLTTEDEVKAKVESEGYRVAREYMIRLEAKDFEDPSWVEILAAAANMTAAEFCNRFGYFSGQVP